MTDRLEEIANDHNLECCDARTVEVGSYDLTDLLLERRQSRELITHLQARGTQLLNAYRAIKRGEPDPLPLEDLSKRAVSTVLTDLLDRRGIRHAWDGIDDDIRDEIRTTLQAKVLEEFRR